MDKQWFEADVIFYDAPEYPCACGNYYYRFTRATGKSTCEGCGKERVNVQRKPRAKRKRRCAHDHL
jgi:hypothetical protein